MGMSSSQARLLSLTARQHDVEWKAQKLQAEKLQMANESDSVYNVYMDALSATKIQTRIASQYEVDTFRDASLATLEHGILENHNGVVAAKTLFLQSTKSDSIFITKDIADAWGITKDSPTYTGTLNEFLVDQGFNKDKVVGYTPKTVSLANKPADAIVIGYVPVENKITKEYELELDYSNVKHQDYTVPNPDFTQLQNEVTKITEFDSTLSAAITNNTITANGNKTYSISSPEELKALMELDASKTAGNTFVLTGDIDLSGYDWEGMKDFAGTFDGNGHTISNLTSTTNGLFQSIKGNDATVENVIITNANITIAEDPLLPDDVGYGIIVGANLGGTIKNVTVDGSIEARGHIGGIVGTNMDQNGKATTIAAGGKIYDANANVQITSRDRWCVGGISGHNSGTISGCNSSGTINCDKEADHDSAVAPGVVSIGGLVGHNYGETLIENSSTDVVLNTARESGIVIGYSDNVNKLTINNVSYIDKEGDSAENILASHDFSDDNPAFCLILPSIDVSNNYKGGFYSNIYAGMVKYYDEQENFEDKAQIESKIDEAKISAYIGKIYSTYTDETERLQAIANVNETIYRYLSDDVTEEDKKNMATIIGDIENTTYSLPEDIYGYDSQYFNAKLSSTNDSWNCVEETKGTIEVPSENTIKNTILVAAEMDGTITITDEQINEFLKKNNSNTQRAAINQVLTEAKSGSNNKLKNLLNAVKNNEQYESLDSSKYNYTISTANPNIQVIINEPIYDWDYSNSEIQNTMIEYEIRKSGFIIIGDDNDTGMDTSTAWLTNMINCGEAQLCEFDFESFRAGNDELKIKATSVATETSMQEVADTEFVKRAEADYEAAMRKINRKETKIDTELSALEAERTSIKTEQEGLKTIIRDNVDLTFKLFS